MWWQTRERPPSRSTKHPILLNARHHVTRLIVEDCHRRVKHGGVVDTLAQLRSEYWGDSMYGESFFNVSFVNEWQDPHTNLQIHLFSQYHELIKHHHFTYTGIDFAGPLYLTNSGEKLWICLFTCGVVRAVHLEVVTDLSAQSFVRCLSRFIARRGLPSVLITDNAKTFKSAGKILRITLCCRVSQ